MFWNIFVVLAVITFVNEMGCLRVTDLRISPPAVERGGSVTLECQYELNGDPLYCVKWYRGYREFYRYSFNDQPNTRVFPFGGINVDLSGSNATQVVLQRVDFTLTGNFTCEVSIDAPSFSTATARGYLAVVCVPQGSPVIVAENSLYDPGDILRANCTAPPARPRPNITMLINNIQISPGLLKQREVDRGLYQSQLSVSLLLLPEHFSSGPPMLRCIARVLDLYAQSAELHLRSSRGAPRIERVTSNGCSRKMCNIFHYFIFTIIVIICFNKLCEFS